MADSHRTLLQFISDLNKDRKKAFEGISTPYSFFWDLYQNPQSLSEIFAGDLSRKEAAKELPKAVSGQFAKWLPPKIGVSFLSAFERDARAMSRSRMDGYRGASVAKDKQAALLDNFMKSLDKLEGRQA